MRVCVFVFICTFSSEIVVCVRKLANLYFNRHIQSITHGQSSFVTISCCSRYVQPRHTRASHTHVLYNNYDNNNNNNNHDTTTTTAMMMMMITLILNDLFGATCTPVRERETVKDEWQEEKTQNRTLTIRRR